MKTPTSIEAPSDAFYVEVYFNGYRRIIEFTGTGSEILARTLIPESDAPTEQVIANGDYEEDVDLENCRDPQSAVAIALQVVTDDIRNNIYWLAHWEDRGTSGNPRSPASTATSSELALTAAGSK